MPEVEPVTSAVFPERSIFMMLSPTLIRWISGADSPTAIGAHRRVLPNKKAALKAPLFTNLWKSGLRGFRGLFLHRARIQALGVDVAVDEFNHRHRRVVAVAEAGLDDAGIAALPILVAGGDDVEQLADLILVAHLRDRLAAHRKAALLAERDQLLHDRAQFLRLRQRGDDLLVLDQRRAHIGEHRLAMLGGAIELPMNLAVTHDSFL